MHDDGDDGEYRPDRNRDRDYLAGRVHARLARVHRLAGETVRCYGEGRYADCESLARTLLATTITDLFDPLTSDEIANWDRHEQWHRGLMAHAWGYLGLSRFRQNDAPGAVAALRYACLATPEDFRPWLRLAGVEIRIGRVLAACHHAWRGVTLAAAVRRGKKEN